MPALPSIPTPNSQLTSGQVVRVTQIICGAMVTAILTFMVIAHVAGNAGQPPMLAYLGLGFASLILALQYVIPGVAMKTQISALTVDDVDRRSPQLCQAFQTRTIIRLALLEGASFFNLVAYMVERQWWSVGVTGFLVALMLLGFPTMNQFDSWAEELRRSIENQF